MARLSISTPTVIQTELKPLDDSFYIEADGQLEQWYYDNTAQYAPNHRITPLVLTPHLSAFDSDTQTSYSSDATGSSKLTFSTFSWYALEYDAAQDKYVETEISNVIDGANVKYIKSSTNDGKLTVKANITYAHAVTLRCVVVYIDPRDSGITHTVQETVTLTTSRDATVVLPSVAMTNPSARSYNPLTDDSSEFEFNAVITNNPDMSEEQAHTLAKYKVDGWGTEEILPGNSDGLATCVPTLDIDYPDGSGDYGAEFFYRPTANGQHLNMSGDAAITSVKGNTVSWNQLVHDSNFESTNWWLCLNAPSSFTIVNNKCTIVVAGGTTLYTGVRQNNIGFIDSHKYYLRFTIECDDSSVVFVCYNGTSSLPGFRFTTEAGTTSNIVTFNGQSTNQYLSIGKNTAPVLDTDMTFSVSKVSCIDLTLIYGAGNEPTTPEAFEADYEAWFGKPLTYEAYNAGELIPVKTTHIRSTGFNIFDNELEYGGLNNQTGIEVVSSVVKRSVNYISVLPSEQYYFSNQVEGEALWVHILFYDGKKKYLGYTDPYSPKSTTSANFHNPFTTPKDCKYIRIRLSNNLSEMDNDYLCINLVHDGSRNGEYEASWVRKAKLNIASITGKLNGQGNSVKVFPDGLKKAGNVYDEVFLDGGVLKAIKRIGSVDLGTLRWNTASTATDTGGKLRFVGSGIESIVKIVSTANIDNIKIYKYKAISGNEVYTGIEGISILGNGTISIFDLAYANSDKDTFKAAMSGVMLYYELAEPEEYILDSIQDFANFVWYGVDGGEEKRVDTLPYYVSGQETDTLKVDAMFGENINIVLRATKDSSTTELSPSKAFASVAWKIPEIDTYVQSLYGGAVRGDTTSMTFSTIVNVKGGDTLTEAKKTQHLRFNWKYRNSAGTNVSEQDAGWGNQVTIAASNLRHTIGSTNSLASTLVLAHVYLLGAWHPVTSASVPYNKPTTTKNGVTYERTIE